MITLLRVLFVSLSAAMGTVILSTSLESSLIAEWPDLASIPWMRATILDFYALMVPVMFWMWYRETSTLPRVLWSIVFVGLGSIATSAYVAVRLFQVDARADIADVLLRDGTE